MVLNISIQTILFSNGTLYRKMLEIVPPCICSQYIKPSTISNRDILKRKRKKACKCDGSVRYSDYRQTFLYNIPVDASEPIKYFFVPLSTSYQPSLGERWGGRKPSALLSFSPAHIDQGLLSSHIVKAASP